MKNRKKEFDEAEPHLGDVNSGTRAEETKPNGGKSGLLTMREPLGRCILGALVLILIYFKCVNFYLLQGNRAYSFIFAAATSLIICAVYLIISVFSPKAANITSFTLYVLLSVIFAVGTIYFAYAHRLPSFFLLKVAGQVDDVSGAVGTLISWRHMLFLADFPVWAVYGVVRLILKRKMSQNKNADTADHSPQQVSVPRYVHTIATSAGTILVALFIVVSTLFSNFETGFLKNEFFAFYANDIGKIIGVSDKNVNISSYINGGGVNDRFSGIARGRNLVILQVEALQSFIIGNDYLGEEITPNLNALIKNDSLYFDNYYYQVGGGNTSDAEFTVNNSLYSTEEGGAYNRYPDNDYYGLPWLLKDEGYATAAFHGNTGSFWNRENAYVKQGFDTFYSAEDMAPDSERHDFAAKGGISDGSMFTQTAEILSNYRGPFYAFIITLSTHNPFSVPPHERYIAKDDTSPNLVTLYVQAARYFDTVLGEFIEDLKARGLYDNTIFVIYGDHYAISGELTGWDKYEADVSEKILGRPFTLFDSFNVPLIIHIPGMGVAKTVHTVGAHVDVLPTLLDLFGLKNDKSVMFGHDLLDPNYDGVAYEMTHTKIGSFITSDMFYSVTNTHPYVIRKDGGDPGDVSQYAALSEKAAETITDCQALLDQNEIMTERDPNESGGRHIFIWIAAAAIVIAAAAAVIIIFLRRRAVKR